MSTVARLRAAPKPPKAGRSDRSAEVSPVTPSGYFRWRGAIHWVAGAFLLVLAAPIIVVVAIAVRLTSPGPAIYRQKRVGKNGRIFTLYKMRSMRVDAEANTGPVWSVDLQDPRVTPLGRFLRYAHLDELPQLINVVNGEMALVGPRPERPEFTEVLAEQIPGYTERLRVAPGITGLAQINLAADTDLDSVRKKLAVDLEYIRAASLRLECLIMLCTAFRLFGIRSRELLTLTRTARNPAQSSSSCATSPHLVDPPSVAVE